MTCNEALFNEMLALNAIYGEGTAVITASTTTHEILALRPPETKHAFLLRVPDSYPQNPLQLSGVDASLYFQSTDRTCQRSMIYFQALLYLHYSPEDVVLYNVIEHFLSITGELAPLKEEENHNIYLINDRLAELVEAVEARSRLNTTLILPDAPPLVQCSVCLDSLFEIDALSLPCKHSYCVSCFQEGVRIITVQQQGSLRCCGDLVPYTLVAKYGNLQPEALDTSEPLHCFYAKCSTFIPTLRRKNNTGSCPAEFDEENALEKMP
ncbi:vacuolar ATP synthase catalytic subunit a [Seiridium cupressi]